MAFWMPLAFAGGSWLANKLFGGGKPKAPDIKAPQYQPGIDTSAWLGASKKALKDETTQWLQNQMRGIMSQGWGRGLGTSSYVPEMGERASVLAARNLSSGLANLEAQAAQMQQGARLQGMQQYGQDYQSWLQATQGQSGQFLGSLMQLLGQLDWGGGGK